MHARGKTRGTAMAMALLLVPVLAFITASQAGAAPPDYGPATGNATATARAGCSRPAGQVVAFVMNVTIKNGVMTISDPGGTTSGMINPDGTAQLNGSTESYTLQSQSADNLTLVFIELNGGCTFDTKSVFPPGFPKLAGGTTAPTTVTTSGGSSGSGSSNRSSGDRSDRSGSTNNGDDGSDFPWWILIVIGAGGVILIYVFRGRLFGGDEDTGSSRSTSTSRRRAEREETSAERRRREEREAQENQQEQGGFPPG